MIKITDLGGSEIYINPDLIERIDLVPDTVLTLTTGKRLVTRNRPEEIIERIESFKQRCHDPARNLRDLLQELLKERKHG